MLKVLYYVLIVLFLKLLLIQHVMADPFQLIESESAVLNNKGNLEIIKTKKNTPALQ